MKKGTSRPSGREAQSAGLFAPRPWSAAPAAAMSRAARPVPDSRGLPGPARFTVFSSGPAAGLRIQRLTETQLPERDYGRWQSREALDLRLQADIHPKQNVATFHFAARPEAGENIDEAEDLGTKTVASTGFGHYVTVKEKRDLFGKAVQDTKKINTSHSEHQVIDELRKLEDGFPDKKVVDWVYTERPPCPDVWYGNKKIEKGCRTELQEVENTQKLRKWDKDKGGEWPYANRDDLGIDVFYTFESASEIKAATFFAPLRRKYWILLENKLAQVYKERYSEGEMSSIADDALPDWEGLPSTKQAQQEYEQDLIKAAKEVLLFLPLRENAVAELSNQLEGIYYKEYDDSEIVDSDAYDVIPGRAWREAETAIPHWSDLILTLDEKGKKDYLEEIEEAKREALSNARGEMILL